MTVARREDVISQSILFPACVDVLERDLLPLHYKDLVLQAIRYLGLREEDYHITKMAEDVRQWLPKRFPAVYYTGSPDYMMMMRYWLISQTQRAFNFLEPIAVPTSAKAAFNGSFDALLRARWTQAKKEERTGGDPRKKPFSQWDRPDWRRYIQICERQAKGKTIEAQFVQWCRGRWPELILDPENAGEYDKPCSHDFRIQSPFGNVVEVDVAGEGIFGEYGSTPYGKSKADIHVCCRLDHKSDAVIFDGFQSRKSFGEFVSREYTVAPQVFIVWMNCWQKGIRYGVLCQRALEAA